MAAASSIKAGAAYVELFVKDSRLTKGLQAASQKLKAFGAGLTAVGATFIGIGATILAPLAATTQVFASAGDQLAKMSARTGISVEALSELAFAAEQSGADMETLEGGLRKMQQVLVEAAGGSKSAQESLDLLGLTVADLARLSPDEQFKLIADRLSQMQHPALRTAAALDLFGKSGTRLLPLMANGAQGIEELEARARQLGLTMSTEDAKAAEAFGDTLSDLWKVIKAGVVAIGGALAPMLSALAERITSTVVTVSEWIRNNSDLIVTVFKVAAAVVAAGAAVAVLGTAISGLGTVLGAVATVFTAVGAAVGVLGSLLAFLLTPIGLVIAGVSALAAFLITSTNTGAEALSWLGDRFSALKDTALRAWQGIGDALAAGDIGLAAKILWLTLKMEWQKGVNFLEAKWLAFKGFFVEIFHQGVFAVARFLTDAWAGIQIAWVETVSFLANAWTNFTALVQKGWNSTQGVIQKGMAHIMGLFDSDLDVQDVVRRIETDVGQKNTQVERQRRNAVAEREQFRQQRRAEIEEERTSIQQGLDTQQTREQAERERRHQAALKESEDALADARREWEDALTEAAHKRALAEAEPGAPPRLRPPGPFSLDDLEGRFRGLDDVIDTAEQKIDVAGTFNAAAVGGLGSDQLAERTAKGVEQVAANTRKLLLEAQMGGLVFS